MSVDGYTSLGFVTPVGTTKTINMPDCSNNLQRVLVFKNRDTSVGSGSVGFTCGGSDRIEFGSTSWPCNFVNVAASFQVNTSTNWSLTNFYYDTGSLFQTALSPPPTSVLVTPTINQTYFNVDVRIQSKTILLPPPDSFSNSQLIVIKDRYGKAGINPIYVSTPSVILERSDYQGCLALSNNFACLQLVPNPNNVAYSILSYYDGGEVQ